jgi:endonuclease YncB( thermonuclease family)
MKRAPFAALLLQLTAGVPSLALPADILSGPGTRIEIPKASSGARLASTIAGRVTVLDGRTLWFPQHGAMVQLADIDSCELPQWSYDPKRHGERAIPKPVPCGPLAKAWLKRAVGAKRISCRVTSSSDAGTLIGVCAAGGGDLALEMLRVGWARVKGPYPSRPDYVAWQRRAMSARYGIWETYVLDMDEWRRKAMDRTLSRRPISDFNLLAERESEISPPFDDARKRPRRTGR